jgi:hypothetical protein
MPSVCLIFTVGCGKSGNQARSFKGWRALAKKGLGPRLDGCFLSRLRVSCSHIGSYGPITDPTSRPALIVSATMQLTWLACHRAYLAARYVNAKTCRRSDRAKPERRSTMTVLEASPYSNPQSWKARREKSTRPKLGSAGLIRVAHSTRMVDSTVSLSCARRPD